MPHHPFAGVAVCFASIASLCAQTATPPPDPQFTLNVSSRLVVEDVTVTDAKGRSVAGLPQSAFHVLDDKVPQTILSFREQESAAAAAAPAVADRPPAGVVTNMTLLRNHGNLVALLIDPLSMQLQDQMYLRLQALKFISTAPAGIAMALFRVNSEGIPVLLQPFTQDRALVDKAISTAVPVMTRPATDPFHNAIAELKNISDYLRQVPGHKALLWMAGAFPLYIPPEIELWGGSKPDVDVTAELDQTKEAYRTLAEARIAVYPIDVRGVQMGGLSATPVLNRSTSGPDPVPGALGATPLSASAKAGGQYDEMDRLADATGGQAFYSNNNIAGVMNTALELATAGYSLTYRPTAYQPDGAWHVVKVTVAGPYTVHFRTGYYASSDANTTPDRQHRALAGDQPGPAAPGAGSASQSRAVDTNRPLMFSARVLAEGKQGKITLIKVRYVIPDDQLAFGNGTAEGSARFRLAALAYNAEGDVLSHGMEIIETHYSATQRELAKRIGTPADQTIEVAQGAQYLLLAVEDLHTEKVGTVQLPLATVPGDTK